MANKTSWQRKHRKMDAEIQSNESTGMAQGEVNHEVQGGSATEALVPLTLDTRGLEPCDANFHQMVFEERRREAVAELRDFTGLPGLVNKLRPDNVYRLVVPDGTVLQKGADGLFNGVFYSDGKISQHAKFSTVPQNLVSVASAIGSQVLLISIAMQLNRLEAAISRIDTGLRNDRIALINAGISQYELARGMKGAARTANLSLAIQSLTQGIEQTSANLRDDIMRLPEPHAGFFREINPFSQSTTDKAAAEFRRAEDLFFALMRGAYTLSHCCAALREFDASASILGKYIKRIRDCGVMEAASKARLVPVGDDGRRPETPWLEFDKRCSAFFVAAKSRADMAEVGHRRIVVECKGKELLEMV